MSNSISLRRLRFSLSQLITVTSLVSLVVTAYVLYGLLGTFFCVVAILLFLTVFRVRTRLIQLILLLAGFACLWLLCIHEVYEISLCPSCGFRSKEIRYLEILRIPVIFDKEQSRSIFTRIMEDFDCPCQHEQLETAKYYDYWGKISRFSNDYYTVPFTPDGGEWDQWYAEKCQPLVIRFACEQPKLAKEFCERIRQEWDHDYLSNFLSVDLHLPEFNAEKSD